MSKVYLEDEKVYLEYQSIVLTETVPDKPYGDWYRELEVTPLSVSNKKPKHSYYEEFTIKFQPKDKIYLVRGVYSEGDSFGCEEGSTYFIELFETIEEAEAFASRVEAHDKIVRNNFYNMTPTQKKQAIKYLMDTLRGYYVETPDRYHKGVLTDGNGKTYYFPWGGYFENLRDVMVDTIDYTKEE